MDDCGKARRKNDGSVDRAIRLKYENQRDWRSAYGDGPVSTDDGVTRLSDRKLLLEIMQSDLPNGQDGL